MMNTVYAEFKEAKAVFEALTLNIRPEERAVIMEYVYASERRGYKRGFIRGYDIGQRHARQNEVVDGKEIRENETAAETYFRHAYEGDE
jgi:hypothetical protein